MGRRLIAAAALAALGLSATVPLASAHDERYVHEFAWTASPEPTTANDGAEVYSNDEVVAAKGYMVDGIKRWDVIVRPVSGGQPSSCHEELGTDDRGAYPQTVYINCPWDTTRAIKREVKGTSPQDALNSKFQRPWQTHDLGGSVNGKYTIEITFTNAGQRCGALFGCHFDPDIPIEPHPLYQSGSNPPRWREVWVTNDVSEPTRVASSFDPATRRIAVTWAPNPEPDAFYVVQEKVGDGKWGNDATLPGNVHRFERAADEPGKYQYQVRAIRPSPTRDSANAVRRSDYVAASAIDVPPPPPATAGDDGSGGPAPSGPEPGLSVPRDTSTSTSPAGSAAPTKAPSRKARPNTASTGRSRPAGSTTRPTGSRGPVDHEAEGEGPDEGFSSFLPYTEPRDGFIEDFGEDDEEEVSMLPGVPVPRPRDTRALLVPMAAGLALFVFAMQGIVFLRRRPAVAGSESDFDDFDGWLRY